MHLLFLQNNQPFTIRMLSKIQNKNIVNWSVWKVYFLRIILAPPTRDVAGESILVQLRFLIGCQHHQFYMSEEDHLPRETLYLSAFLIEDRKHNDYCSSWIPVFASIYGCIGFFGYPHNLCITFLSVVPHISHCGHDDTFLSHCCITLFLEEQFLNNLNSRLRSD